MEHSYTLAMLSEFGLIHYFFRVKRIGFPVEFTQNGWICCLILTRCKINSVYSEYYSVSQCDSSEEEHKTETALSVLRIVKS